MIKEKNMNSIRHGEAWLLPVKSVKGTYKEVTSVVVAHSETGHHHVLKSVKPFRVYSDEELYLRLYEPAKLVHKKTVNAHKTLEVKPGIYKVIQKKEYNPFTKMMTRIFD
jgi:hypothetical protein